MHLISESEKRDSKLLPNLLFLDTNHQYFETNTLVIEFQEKEQTIRMELNNPIIQINRQMFGDFGLDVLCDNLRTDFVIVNNKNDVWFLQSTNSEQVGLNDQKLTTDTLLRGLNTIRIGRNAFMVNTDSGKLF